MYSFVKIAILPNGYFKRTRNAVCVQNTTAIDAFLYPILCHLADNEDLLKQTLQSIESSFLKQFISTYLKKGAVQQTLIARNFLLINSSIFKIDIVDGMKTMNCDTTIENITKHFAPQIFKCRQLRSKCHCDEMVESTNISFFKLIDEIMVKLGSNSNINFSCSASCKQCKQIVEYAHELNDVVFFVGQRKLLWKDVPKYGIFENNAFLLSSVIESISEKHLITHVLRPNGKWYTFDNSKVTIDPFTPRKSSMKIELLSFAVPSVLYSKNHQLLSTSYPNGNQCLTVEYIIQNFHYHRIDKTIFSVKNVCGPDSLIHSLLCIYNEQRNLFSRIDDSDEIMKLISAYFECDLNTVYNMRISILKKHFVPTLTDNGVMEIDCYSNIRNTLDNLFAKSFPSLKSTCCCGKSETSYATIDIDYKKLSTFGLNNIEKCIFLPERKCTLCQSKSAELSISNIVFIDVQPLSIDDITAHENINLDIIQKTLNINNQQFHLKCVIDHQSIGHYTMSFLQENGKWYNFDDLLEQVRELNSLITPHILIYTHYHKN